MSGEPVGELREVASEERLAEIKLRLLNLPHSVWSASGCGVVRSGGRGAGIHVAECSDESIAEVVANAPRDIETLVREVEVAHMQIDKLRQQLKDADRAALSARAECGQWKDRALSMRSAWRALNDEMGRR